MKIKNIVIENFRSIEKASITVSDFNVFVGQNNHGKTNIFEALNWFYGYTGNIEEIKFMRDSSKIVSVTVEFIDIKQDLDKQKNENHKKAIEKIIQTDDSFLIKRTSSYKEGKQRLIYDKQNKKWVDPIGRDTAWRDLLPKIEYVSARKHLEEVAKYGRTTPVGEMLSGVLEAILEQDKGYKEFKEKFNDLFGSPTSASKTNIRVELDKLGDTVALYLQKQFPDCTKVEFKVDNPDIQDLLKRFATSVDDGILNDADEKGDGMQRALMLAIIQTYTEFRKKHEDIDKTFIFLIDEGELHLHPTAQRALKNALLDISKQGDQVLLNTHSSVLVVDNTPFQIIFKVEKVNKKTEVTLIKSDREKSNVIYQLLGGSPADLLLPRNFLIVEGLTEFNFINQVISNFYSTNPDIQIVYAEGDITQQKRSFNSINKLYSVLYIRPVYRDKVIILGEKPRDQNCQQDLDKFTKEYPSLSKNKQLFILPVTSIEEYYPKPWKKTQKEVKNLKLTPEGHEKIMLALECGANITKEQFEKEMKVIHSALLKCWNEAYK